MKKYIRHICIAIILLMSLVVISACANSDTAPDQSNIQENAAIPGAPEKGGDITCTGFEGGEFSISQDAFMKYTPVETEVTSINSSGTEKTFTIKAAKLEDMLAEKNLNYKELTSLIISAIDGYSIEIPSEVLSVRDLLMVYERDGEPLETAQLVIPEERAMYWVKDISSIEAVTSIESVPVKTIVVLDTVLPEFPVQDIGDADRPGEAALCSDLLAKYFDAKDEFVEILAEDGMTKNEKYDIFASAMIRYNGEESMYLGGPEMSIGMSVKRMAAFRIHDTLGLSMKNFLELHNDKKLTDKNGYSMNVFTMLIDMIEFDTLIVTGIGKEIEIPKDSLGGAVISHEDGAVSISFGGDTLQNVQKIEAK